MYTDSWSRRYNFDGLLSYSPISDSGSTNSYIQIYRNGIIEAVESSIIRIFEGKKVIPDWYEAEVLGVLDRIKLIYNELGINSPLIVLLTLIGVKGYRVEASGRYIMSLRDRNIIERDILVIPEVVVEEDEFDSKVSMKPIFDTVWNSSGWPQSLNYNEKGEWIKKW